MSRIYSSIFDRLALFGDVQELPIDDGELLDFERSGGYALVRLLLTTGEVIMVASYVESLTEGVSLNLEMPVTPVLAYEDVNTHSVDLLRLAAATPTGWSFGLGVDDRLGLRTSLDVEGLGQDFEAILLGYLASGISIAEELREIGAEIGIPTDIDADEELVALRRAVMPVNIMANRRMAMASDLDNRRMAMASNLDNRRMAMASNLDNRRMAMASNLDNRRMAMASNLDNRRMAMASDLDNRRMPMPASDALSNRRMAMLADAIANRRMAMLSNTLSNRPMAMAEEVKLANRRMAMASPDFLSNRRMAMMGEILANRRMAMSSDRELANRRMAMATDTDPIDTDPSD